jgi:hypothetical protein
MCRILRLTLFRVDWKQYLEPLSAKGVKLISPAITNSGPPNGITWMDEFMENCSGCTFDAIGEFQFLETFPLVSDSFDLHISMSLVRWYVHV